MQGDCINEYLPCEWMVVIDGDGFTVHGQHCCRDLLIPAVFFNGQGKDHAGFWFKFAVENFSFDIMDKIFIMGTIGIFGLDVYGTGFPGIHPHEAGLYRF